MLSSMGTAEIFTPCKITDSGAIAGWGDEAMDFDAQPQAGDRSKCWVVLVKSV